MYKRSLFMICYDLLYNSFAPNFAPKNRRLNMATFTKRNNKWRAQVRKKGVSKSAEFETKSEAQKWAAALEKEIELANYNPFANTTFSQVIDRYIKEYTVKKRGAREEKLRLFRICDTSLGQVAMDELSQQDLREWQNKRLSEVSSASVLRERIAISAVLTQAVKWGYIEKNPLYGLDKPEQPKARTRCYTKQEINALVEASGFTFDEEPKTKYAAVGAAFLFALETAMRAGEICSLTWENVNLTARTAFLPLTKNGHSRTVPLTQKAIKIIERMQRDEDESTVFGLKVSVLGSLFRKLKIKAGLNDVDLHFHDTRRDALTRLSKKVEVMTLAKISGHRDLKILLNTYYAPNMSEIAKMLD